jgi:hypothetical protein
MACMQQARHRLAKTGIFFSTVPLGLIQVVLGMRTPFSGLSGKQHRNAVTIDLCINPCRT